MMDLSKIMAIAGKPGLYKMISQTKNGIIVESFLDQKRFAAFTNERISSLKEISVFTTGEDISLKDVFRKMFDKLNGAPAPDPKSSDKEIKAFFEETLPEYDRERVYTSDLKKILMWYNILKQHEVLDFTEEEVAPEGVAPEEEISDEPQK